MEFHPEANLNRLIRDELKSSKTSLAELCDGRRIGTSRYLQAATLWKMLLSEERYRSKLKELIERLAAANSTNLGPHLDLLWETDFEKLAAEWREFCGKQFHREE